MQNKKKFTQIPQQVFQEDCRQKIPDDILIFKTIRSSIWREKLILECLFVNKCAHYANKCGEKCTLSLANKTKGDFKFFHVSFVMFKIFIVHFSDMSVRSFFSSLL